MNFGLFETIHYYPEFENREFREVLKIHNKFGTVPIYIDLFTSVTFTSDDLTYSDLPLRPCGLSSTRQL